MTIRPLLLVTVTLAPLLPPAIPAAAQDRLAITSVTVLDVAEGALRPHQTVILSGDRIAAVGDADAVEVPAGAVVIDGSGSYLIPGLWDMHVHLFNQVSQRPPNLWYFPLFVANGVTGVREMWTMPADAAVLGDWRARMAAGTLLAPRIAAAGALVDGPGSLWPTSERVATAEDARRFVRDVHRAGLDFVKVYSYLPREAYFAVLEEAARLGLPAAGHIPLRVRAGEAAAAGQRSNEHLEQMREACSTRETEILKERERLYARKYTVEEDDSLWEHHKRLTLDTFDESVCRAVAERLAAAPLWQVPTLVNERRWYLGNTDPEDPRLAYVPGHERRVWQEGYGSYGVVSEDLAAMTYSGPAEQLMRKWTSHLDLVRVLNRAGVPFLAGTDLGGPYLYPGFSLHDELELLVEAGLSPLEALRAATLNPARYLEATDSLGTVAPGKLADLVLLSANPLEDIRNTRRIAAVVLNGRYLDRAVLDRWLAEAERAAEGGG
jgi:cytosine/adenosine deaminase-related metal-dependent hydrolase